MLDELILVKEAEHKAEGELLKVHFLVTYESLRPINILKSTFKEAVNAPGIKAGVVNTFLGLAAGFLAKKILVGSTQNPLKKILAAFIETIVSGIVNCHGEEVKSFGNNIVKKFIKPSGNTEKHE